MISIIGAGPAGNYLAYLLAKSGKEVSVFEEHSCIGKPIHCTGLVTSSINKLIPLKKELILNKIYKAKIIFRDSFIEINFKEPNYVLDRAKFDSYLADLAISAGAKYHLNYKFKNFKKPYIVFENRKALKTNILVGADGASSKVSKLINPKKKFVVGLQIRAKIKSKPDTLNFYLDEDYFGWFVPESDSIAKIGIVTSINPNLTFKEFLKKFPKAEKIEYQSGLIPIYNTNIKTQEGNIYLLGDSAAMVKATTYGGIIQGMEAAEELSKSILNNQNYGKLWKKRIGKELYLHLLIRKTLDKFTKQDYSELFKLINPRIKKILQEHNRDDLSSFAFKLLIAEPKLLKFGFKLL